MLAVICSASDDKLLKASIMTLPDQERIPLIIIRKGTCEMPQGGIGTGSYKSHHGAHII